MRTDNKWSGDSPDAGLEEVLGDFRASVHAWSEAAYNRPRTVRTVRRLSWRLAAGWAMGCVLVACGLTGGIYEHHLRQDQARIVARDQARPQQMAPAERTQVDDADLLATVDSDVSREVPSAMEPLAQLMDEDSNR